jgi:hypothetical protein
LLNDQWIIEEIRGEINKFLEFNENENTTYQNVWDTAMAVLSGKFKAESFKIVHYQINNTIFHTKVIEK